MTRASVTRAGYDTVIVGAGTAGSAIAGLLAGASDERVLLAEAGPDYGPRASGDWPAELLDASQLPLTHDWGYAMAMGDGRRLALDRARVIGGCSSHNGCQVVLGHRSDYDGWAAAGNSGWAADDLHAYIDAATRRLRTRRFAPDEITPFHRAALAAMEASGLPLVDDLNDLDEGVGAAPNPANVVDGVRWNSAFAYLDPVRDRPNLAILDGALCDRLELRGNHVTGVVLRVGGERVTVQAGRVVLCAGAYGSPAILLRSGIGAPDALRSAGIAARHALPGVGENLQEHPAIELRFAGTDELVRRSRAFAAEGFHPEEQVVAKARSSRCTEAFDLHLYTQGGARRAAPDHFIWEFMAGVLDVRSRGRVTLRSADPGAAPVIDHRLLSDPGGEDRARLVEGFELLRRIAATEPLAGLLGAETMPGPGVAAEAAMSAVVHAYHPGGSCMMGPAEDPAAVVAADGAVHGLTGAYVADASIMPVLPRANTNLPTAVVAERIASLLADARATAPLPLQGEAWPSIAS